MVVNQARRSSISTEVQTAQTEKGFLSFGKLADVVLAAGGTVGCSVSLHRSVPSIISVV
jgi:hypothetical protein